MKSSERPGMPLLTRFTTHVHADWIDRNEHMNNSFYLVATQEAYLHAIRTWRGSMEAALQREFGNFVTQSLVTYVREVRAGTNLVILSRLVAVDEKRLHIYAEMFDGDRDILSAVVERTSINVRRGRPPQVTPYPAAAYERLQEIQKVHASVSYAEEREPVLLLNAKRPRRKHHVEP